LAEGRKEKGFCHLFNKTLTHTQQMELISEKRLCLR